MRRMLARLALAALLLPTSAPGTITRRRPTPRRPSQDQARCADPVAGVWVGRRYWDAWGEWVVFTLTIRHVQGSADALEGTIENHAWEGPRSQTQPRPCEANALDVVIAQPAVGTWSAGTLSFHGTSWRVARQACRGWSRYNLDHFQGPVDPASGTFTSVNNDGGRDRDTPYIFRRIQCL
ncbi:MAG: hypothetical protein HY909_22220 [Deltaproteobacteria bacterium]|nr:hypothetical protein [Deltaproteobacteria bacterium]